MPTEFTDELLLAYLDEHCPTEVSTEIERVLRRDEPLRQRVAELARHRDHVGHTVGDVWRRRRLTCPDRRELSAYLLGTLEPDRADYVRFHVDVVGCRFCRASLDDLEREAAAGAERRQRRQRHFATSARYLLGDDSDG